MVVPFLWPAGTVPSKKIYILRVFSNNTTCDVLEFIIGPSMSLQAYILWVNTVKDQISEIWMEHNPRNFENKQFHMFSSKTISHLS